MDLAFSSKINQLMASIPNGGLFFSEWMTEQGRSHQLQRCYRDSGWLESIAKGVTRRPGVEMTALAALASYNHQMDKQVRISVHSALEHMGFSPFRPFTTKAFGKIETKRQDHECGALYISVPELAILECLYLDQTNMPTWMCSSHHIKEEGYAPESATICDRG